MIFLKAIILLLVTNVLVQCSFENQKVEETLKKVGKRWYVELMGFKLGTPPLPPFDNPTYNGFVVPENWDNKTEEEVIEFKKNVVKVMGDDTFGQYDPENFVRFLHELNLLAILDDELVVELCDTGVKMNKYQFTEYLRRDRIQYILNDTRNSNYHGLRKDDDPNILTFAQLFHLKSRWNFEVPHVWNVTAKLKETNIGKLFKITHIHIGGACFDYGTIHHNFTDIRVSEHGWTALKKETNPDIQTLINAFTDGPEYADKVPVNWLDGLVENEKDLSIAVCTRKRAFPKFSREQFLAWYEKFRIMWHPVRNGTEDFLRVQVISATPGDMLTARLTMRLQSGSDINSTDIFDWDFRVNTKYNEHGDGKWYIKKLEVMCPLNYEPLTVNLRHIRDVVTKELLAPVDLENGTTPWYTTAEYIRKFTKDGKLETLFCDAKSSINMTQLQLSLYFNRELRTAVIYSYVVDYDDIPHPAEEDSYFRMSTDTYIRERKRPAKYTHEWKFILKWDETVQFYYVSKLEIACPRVFGDPGTMFNIKIPLRPEIH